IRGTILHTHSYKHTLRLTFMHSFCLSCVNAHIHTQSHIHTERETYTRTHTHTHTHTQTHTQILPSGPVVYISTDISPVPIFVFSSIFLSCLVHPCMVLICLLLRRCCGSGGPARFFGV